jgi:hypothetical protein
MTARILLGTLGLLALADCSGVGEVVGSFSETNSGALTFGHGLAWREPDGSFSVLFTDDPVLAEAGRASPDPEYETGHAAEMLGELVVGYRFGSDGRYAERITLGTSLSRGSSGADSGRIRVKADGCARGDVHLDYYGDGSFALPLLQPGHNRHLHDQALERDMRPEAAPAATEPAAVPDEEHPLAQWSAVHARLHAADPAAAMQALNFSPPVAATLARDARALAALARVRSQCPDPASATLDKYGDVGGESRPAPGVTLKGTALTSVSESGAFLSLCYVMQRNGEYIDQCFPFSEDCSRARPPTR